MPSHKVKHLLSSRAVSEDHLEVQFVLNCGCQVTRTVNADRVVELTPNNRVLVGRYTCPKGCAVDESE